MGVVPQMWSPSAKPGQADRAGRGRRESWQREVLTKGASYVALVDARKLDYYHALEAEHAGLCLCKGPSRGCRTSPLAGCSKTPNSTRPSASPETREASQEG